MTSDVSKPMRVALLEDHPLLRDSLALGLRAEGFDVVASTGDPDELSRRLEGWSGVVALVDLRIEHGAEQSGSEGLDAIRTLSARSPAVPCLVFTADGRAETIQRCRAAGAAGFLSKAHAALPEVVRALHRVAQGERDVGLDPGDVKKTAQQHKVPGPLAAISPRELEVLSFISVGADNLKIAAVLGITERTVRAHACSLYSKLGADNRTQLALLAKRCGVEPPAGF